MKKIAVLGAVLGCLVAAGSASAEVGSVGGDSLAATGAPNQTVVMCAPYTFNYDPHWYWTVRPGRCNFQMKNQPVAHAWGVYTKGLHWKYWTKRRAAATGWDMVSTAPAVRIRVKVYRPTTRCGFTQFTRALFRSKYGKSHMKLWTACDILH